jgi:CRISPR system Cascade subunit CasC
MKIELHMIQNVAPSNLNRDDTGAPKDAEFGGVRRARLSSQSMKRAMREQLVLPADMGLDKAVRTLQLVAAIDKHLQQRVDAEESDRTQAITNALASVKIAYDSDKRQTQYLLFLPERSAVKFAEVIAEHWSVLQSSEAVSEGKKKSKSGESKLPKELTKQLNEIMRDAAATPEIALFGRMVADEPTWNVDAACQVAHAISVNKVSSEFDFFTAVDDLKQDTGAGMMGTVQFGSATFYRYLVIDVDGYLRNMSDGGTATAEMLAAAQAALAAFIEVAVKSLPSGKQNTFAAHNLPSLVMTVVREDAPVALTNAFLRPVTATAKHDLVEHAIVKLDQHFGAITQAYGSSRIRKVQTLVVGAEVGELAHIQANGAAVATLEELIATTLRTCFGGAS